MVLPPHARGELDLTADQEKALAALEKEVKERLQKILTPGQQKAVEGARPRGPGGPPGAPPRGPGGPPPDGLRGPGGERSTTISPDELKNLVRNPDFTRRGADAKTPAGYALLGDVEWTTAGKEEEFAPRGVALHSGKDLDGDGTRAGSVAQDVTGFDGGAGRWFRFTFRGLAESSFAVKNDELFMKVDFFAAKGTNYLDGVSRKLYPLVERDREELALNGNFRKNGAAVWKTYALEFKLPFAEIDQLRLSVGFKDGRGEEKESVFLVTDFALVPITAPDAAPKAVKTARGHEPSLKKLVPLGGRWYYDPEGDAKEKPARLTVRYTNAGRLYYLDGRLTNPFAENMTAWLRKGYKDIEGKLVEEDRLIADNVVVRFEDDNTMIVRARNIPNHPTAQFPELRASGGRNPSYIQEYDSTYYLPLNPVRNPRAVAMDKTNSNRALPMGPIGIAINGVVFFNPFDAGGRDASDIMDRCCGHPSPDNRYHYHKYPVCVKSPFVDEGEEHSPLIGWAFDGFPTTARTRRRG
jgi:hypothetical protein